MANRRELERSPLNLLTRADGYKYEEISEKTELSVRGVQMQVKPNLAKFDRLSM